MSRLFVVKGDDHFLALPVRFAPTPIAVRTTIHGREALDRVAAEQFNTANTDPIRIDADRLKALDRTRTRQLNLPARTLLGRDPDGRTIEATTRGARNYFRQPTATHRGSELHFGSALRAARLRQQRRAYANHARR